MSSADYDRYDDRRHRSHRHRDDREPSRYVETKETYIRSPVAPAVPEAPYTTRATELIRRPAREDSDLSIEEVRREFPPPISAGYVAPRYDRYGSSYRSHSAERDYDRRPRRSHNDFDDRRGRNTAVYADEKANKPRRRSLSRNQKVIAGVAGAALGVGSKELWDRRQAGDRRPIARNPLQSAAAGVAGAFVAYEGAELYAKHGPSAEKAKVKAYAAYKGRDGHVDEYYASDEESLKPKRSKSRRKSFVEGALGLAGIGAGAKALGGGRDRDGRSRRGSDETYDSRGRNRSPEGVAKFQQAAKAALLAGATEAFRVRNEPGGWGGEKGKRILTAAIGAGGVNAAADRDPDEHSKRHILEAVVGGLAGNRLINGSRKDVDVDDDGRSIRSRSRSRSRGGGSGPTQGLGLATIATAGLGALVGKKALDRSRSRGASSRKSRRRSPDSYSSRSPSPSYGDTRHKRSKSVTDFARKGLAALGLAGAGAAVAGRDRDRGEFNDDATVRKTRRGDSDGDYSSRRSRHGESSRDLGYAGSRGDVYDDPRHADSRSSVGGGKRRSRRDQPGYNRRVAEGKESPVDSSSDLGSSTDDEKKIKKMKASSRSRY